jgi:exosome complex exonuclease DIS3/RRP44
MNQAVYFCLADFDVAEVFHYGLAVPLYTHFTSPIRRYADVLVHRLLAAAIDIQSLTNDMTDKFKMARQCDQMNRKNRNARLASSASTELNTFLFFRNMQQKEHKRIIEEAMVMRVTKSGIYVMIKSFGVEGLLTEAPGQTIIIDADKGQAVINGAITVQTFDTLKIEVVP